MCRQIIPFNLILLSTIVERKPTHIPIPIHLAHLAPQLRLFQQHHEEKLHNRPLLAVISLLDYR